MKKIRIVLCDSSPEGLLFYEDLCRTLCKHHDVSAEYKTYSLGKNLLFDLDNQLFCKKLDIIFITLCNENTKDLLPSIRKTGYAKLIVVIGTTNDNISHEDLFDHHTFNIIKSRENQQRFFDVFGKAVDTLAKMREEYLSLSYGGELRYIPLSEILYFEKKDRGLVVHYDKGESFFFLSSIAKLEEQLKGRAFLRISLSYLVAVDAVRRIVKNNRDYDAIMRNGEKLPIGRKYYVAIKDAVKQETITE